MQSPLSGIRVLDLTRYLSGPYATLLLAEMGAEVVKVEMPGVGDDTRHVAPFQGGAGAIQDVPYPGDTGVIPAVSLPIRFDGERCPARPAPALGQHNAILGRYSTP